MVAAEKGHTEIAKWLITANADLNLKNRQSIGLILKIGDDCSYVGN